MNGDAMFSISSSPAPTSSSSTSPVSTHCKRLQADYETLSAINPRLIYCAISGYGHTGPYAGRSGYDLAAQGESGTMALTGEPDGPPVRYPVPISDITAGLYTTMSALTALYVREQTGRGQFIDVSLLDSQITWLTNLAGAYFVSGERPSRLGNFHPQIAPYEVFQAADKAFLVAVGSERLWQNFCEAIGVADTIGADPRYATNAERLQLRMELHDALLEVFRHPTRRFLARPVARRPVFPAAPSTRSTRPWPTRTCWPAAWWWRWNTPPSVTSA